MNGSGGKRVVLGMQAYHAATVCGGDMERAIQRDRQETLRLRRGQPDSTLQPCLHNEVSRYAYAFLARSRPVSCGCRSNASDPSVCMIRPGPAS
jgi:hypothetical protein